MRRKTAVRVLAPMIVACGGLAATAWAYNSYTLNINGSAISTAAKSINGQFQDSANRRLLRRQRAPRVLAARNPQRFSGQIARVKIGA